MKLGSRRIRRCVVVVAMFCSTTGWSNEEACTAATYQALRPPRYPKDALLAHAVGTAKVKVRIGADGSVVDVALRSSAGFESLDAAALSAVSEWRFQPERCNGQAVSSEVLVPVDFTLTDQVAAQAWAVVPDTEPMEFDSLKEELAYLNGRTEDVQKESLKAGYTLREIKGPKIWWVFYDPGSTWSMVAHNGNAVLRVTQMETTEGREARYAFLCGGTPSWCKSKLGDYVSYLQEHPLPPPPRGIQVGR